MPEPISEKARCFGESGAEPGSRCTERAVLALDDHELVDDRAVLVGDLRVLEVAGVVRGEPAVPEDEKWP